MLLSEMDRSSIQKINKETMNLNHILDQIDLIYIYRTFHLTEAKYMFFSSARGTFLQNRPFDRTQNMS